jgi:hypothetical protein
VAAAIASRCARAGKALHLVFGENGFDGDLAAISSVTEARTLKEIQVASSAIAGGEIRIPKP